MHVYNDNQYFQYLVYPRFSIIRWIEFVFCLVCLTLAIMVFHSNLHILIKVVTISVSAAFVFICFFDVVAWLFRSPIGYAAWLMISLSAFLFFCLCGGCIFFLKRVTMVYYFYAMGFFFLATALVFLFDYIWMALEYINLRRCLRVTPRSRPTSRLDRGISTCCLCKYDIQPCPKRKPPEIAATTAERAARKIIYPSSNVVCTKNITPNQTTKSHKCGVCPRKKEPGYSAPDVSASEPIIHGTDQKATRNKPRSPQTLPQMPITTLDAEIQEEEYQLPFFKSDIADYPGPPYYLCNILENRNIPSKFYSTLDTVIEKESGEASSRGDYSDVENGTAYSSDGSVESSRSYQTTAASSIKKLFQSNAVLFDYQHPPPTEGGQEMKHINEISEIGRNVESLEIKRSIETIEIKRKVELPEFRRIRSSDATCEGTHSYLYADSTNESMTQKSLQNPTSTSSVQYHIETVKSSIPSRIPIRPESRSVLKAPTPGNIKNRPASTANIQVIKKPLTTPGFVSRLRIRPETRISPCIDDETSSRIELGTPPDRVRIPWFKQEKNVSKSRSPRNESPRKNQQRDTKLSGPKSLTRLNSTPRKMVAETNDSFPSSSGDAGTGFLETKCPKCRTLLMSSSPGSVEKKVSGISTTADTLDSGRSMSVKTYMDGNFLYNTNLGTEGR